jgi:nitrogenase molybdenum-iron protein alpha/beta subunit
MCVPMGAASALCGLKNCMSILHGSQGCATYIRRHMATHYNEPVDIASSSLTEHGTVFGGEENLIKGLENLIALYDPDIIGMHDTAGRDHRGGCGGDCPEISSDTREVKQKSLTYHRRDTGGTQYEGFFRALYAVVSQIEMDRTPNEFINIITPMLSPADCRLLKNLLDSMGLRYILLPDLSENLDGGHTENYERLKSGGASLEDIARMAGARHTIELSLFTDSSYSPAQCLLEKYNEPYTRMA